jgi:transposase
MLSTKEKESRKQIKMISIEDLVPSEHLLRKIENAIDFSFIRDEVKDLYCLDNGRPSIDPVVLFKLCIVNYMYGLNSMRRTIRECEVNMAYRWFLGYDLLEPMPHFTTFGKNYKRRFEGTDIFERIFSRILDEAIAAKLVDASVIFIDGTHIKANANTKKNYKREVELSAKQYAKELRKEIDSDRESHDKKPLKDDDDDSVPPKTKTITESKSDPESGLFHKGEHKKCFAYSASTACDKHNFVVGVKVKPGNIHDSTVFDELYETVKATIGIPEAVAVDAGYKTPWIAKQLLDDNVLPVMPYKSPMTKKGFYKKYEYVYDEYYDCYICPNNEILRYSTTNREGYREYKSNPEICKSCPYASQCTQSKNQQKVVTRHVWEGYLETAEDIRHTAFGRETYALRSETIERVFADAKEKHGMRYTRVNGLAKVKAQVLVTFSCMNLKKLANWKWKTYNPVAFLFAFLRKFFFRQKFQPIFN